MIKKYTYGTPIDTEAVIEKIKGESGTCSFVKSTDPFRMEISLDDDDIVYGLGETVRGMNKRGWHYESFCSDDPEHQETKVSLYGAHNFFIISGTDSAEGFFIDYPGKISFDVGFSEYDKMVITAEKADLDIYLIEADSLNDIVSDFRTMIGKSFIPPLWAFGYGQSRWSYKTEEEVEEVANSCKTNGIPLDMIYLDIDYMDDYKDFTIDEKRFPDFNGFVEKLKKQKIRLIPIIDAGVKIEEGYDFYEEGKRNNYFCKDENGNDFETAVWPGRTYFPDFMQKEVREWFGRRYKKLLDMGIDGFWNDMNEPAIFYSDKHLKEVFGKIKDYENLNMNLETFFRFKDLVGSLSNNEEDYKSFYHVVDGKKVRHYDIHNLYGYNMTRSASEEIQKTRPDERFLLFSRSSYIGMHRYGGIWTGDNKAWWSHLKLALSQMPALNMCGFMYIGPDLGGFGDDTTEDLLMRFISLGVFTPLMRNHSAMGTRKQEPYEFVHCKEIGQLIESRYKLLPYIYSEFMKSVLENKMYFRPLSFDYSSDKMAREVDDQLLVGESIMIAPVYTQNASGRNVYFPEEMKMLRLGAEEDLEGQVIEKGYHYIDMPLDTIVFFLRKGHMLVTSGGGMNVDEVNMDPGDLHIASFADRPLTYRYYHDDGVSIDYLNKDNISEISIQ